jgi:glycosyltransferase involved in cell wall biosynthesis
VARYLAALASVFKDDIKVIAIPEEGCEVFDVSAPFPVERRELLYKVFWPRWLQSVNLLIQEAQTYETVIVSHLLPLGAAAWLAKFFTGKPYIVVVHGQDVSMTLLSSRKRWLASRVLRGAKVVITNSHALSEEIKKDFDVKNTEVIYPSLKNLHRKLGAAESLPANNFTLLTVSRLVARKGHTRVLKAMAELQYKIPNLRYRILGDGPALGEIIRAANELGIYDLVRLSGRVTDTEIAEAYDEANIFIMPTVADQIDREGFGTVYLEAAAHGLPSIATDLPGVDEAVINGQTGILVPDGDAEALKAAILRLWSNPEERQRLGAVGQKRVFEEFVAEKQFEKLRKWI